jgi:hypothetical protein
MAIVGVDACRDRDVDVIDRARIVFTFCWAEFSLSQQPLRTVSASLADESGAVL